MTSEALADVDNKINEMRNRLFNISQCLQRNEELSFEFATEKTCDSQCHLETSDTASCAVEERPTSDGHNLYALDVDQAFTRVTSRGADEGTGSCCTRIHETSQGKESGAPFSESAATCNSDAVNQSDRKVFCQDAVAPLVGNDTSEVVSGVGNVNENKQPYSVPSQSLLGKAGSSFDPLQAMEVRLREKLRKQALTGGHPWKPVISVADGSQGKGKLGENTLVDSLAQQSCSTSREVPCNSTPKCRYWSAKQKHEHQLTTSCNLRTFGTEDIPSRGTDRIVVRSRSAGSETCYPSASRQSHRCPTSCASSEHCISSSARRLTNGLRTTQTAPRKCATTKATRPFCSISPQMARVPPAGATGSGNPAFSVLPLRTTPERTVLDVLTGAEFFALMRLRGVIVSRGETGEHLLPDTRCHSVYLSPGEHRQLLDLRTKLKAQSGLNTATRGGRKPVPQQSERSLIVERKRSSQKPAAAQLGLRQWQV